MTRVLIEEQVIRECYTGMSLKTQLAYFAEYQLSTFHGALAGLSKSIDVC